MAITAAFLKNIMAEARPIIERQMEDAKLIAGFRTVVANAGGDWGALKALIKAHVEDENDETGEGKRVQKIRDKADSTSAYADMLGLANMNKENFSSRSYAEEKGRGDRPANQQDGTGELTDNQESEVTTSRSEAVAKSAAYIDTPATGNDFADDVGATASSLASFRTQQRRSITASRTRPRNWKKTDGLPEVGAGQPERSERAGGLCPVRAGDTGQPMAPRVCCRRFCLVFCLLGAFV